MSDYISSTIGLEL